MRFHYCNVFLIFQVKVKVSVSEDGFTCMTGAGREVKISNDAVSLGLVVLACVSFISS